VLKRSNYAYAAASPLDRCLDNLIPAHVNSHCTQIFTDEIAVRYPNERVVLVLDCAGWHRSQDIRLPDHPGQLPHRRLAIVNTRSSNL